MSEANANETQSGPGINPTIDRVRVELERWLDVARTTGERALETLGVTTAGRPSIPPIDVLESETDVLVLVDLPGVAAENVNLSLSGNMLTIKASRPASDRGESLRSFVAERAATHFERAVPLPASVDAESVRAETRDGLLTVTLRKPTPVPGRSIPVVHVGPNSRSDAPS